MLEEPGTSVNDVSDKETVTVPFISSTLRLSCPA